jgi:hypothetical protein
MKFTLKLITFKITRKTDHFQIPYLLLQQAFMQSLYAAL